MQAVLNRISGPGNIGRIEARAGDTISVGRTLRATLSIPEDTFLSGQHFHLHFRGSELWLVDPSSSNGTFVNGVRTQEHVLYHRDLVNAGSSTFQIVYPDPAFDLTEYLLALPGHLYAIVDMAQAKEILGVLYGVGCCFQSLYIGENASQLELVAPYLVYFPPDGKLLRWLAEKGWGKSWGVFLSSSQPFELVANHLRRFLMVCIEGDPEAVFFRFYDPRILRRFLPIAEQSQLEEFFGPVTTFMMEEEDPDTLAVFNFDNRNCHAGRFHVAIQGGGDRAR